MLRLASGLGFALLAAAAAAQPAPDKPLPFPMPSLSDAGLRRTFESRVGELCRSVFKIEEIDAANDTPRDTFVCPTPSPKTAFGCRARVRVYISNGMPRQPPYDEKTGNRTPEPCSEPVDDGLTPAPPPAEAGGQPPGGDTSGATLAQPATSWPMADLAQLDGAARLEADTQRYCQRGAAMQESRVESNTLPQGALVSQSPQPGIPISCATPILVVRSNGSSCPTAPPLSVRRLFMGDSCTGPILSGWKIAVGAVALAGISLLIARRLRRPPKPPPSPRQPKPPEPLKGKGELPPAPHIVPGTAQLMSRPDPGGLHRQAPDLVLEASQPTVMTTAQVPLGIQTVEISDG